MRGLGVLFTVLLSLSPAYAQDTAAQCQQKMERCWIANNGSRGGSLETTKDGIKRSKEISRTCNTKLICGWQTGTEYTKFACPPGQAQQCEIGQRSQSERFFQYRQGATHCDPRTQRC